MSSTFLWLMRTSSTLPHPQDQSYNLYSPPSSHTSNPIS
jgi:hypothetical protein